MIAFRPKILTSGILLTASALAIAACSPSPKESQTPPPSVSRPPMPQPYTPPPPTPSNWMDQPRTAGSWSYRPGNAVSLATYGVPGRDPVFAAQCDRRSRTVSLLRADQQARPAAMRIITETQNRVLSAKPVRSGYPAQSAALAGNDPLLDAMAFTKGRFAVEMEGTATLYVPSWTEFSRIVEDCR